MSETLTFKQFGRTWVVVGEATAIAAAVKAGKATVALKDGTMKAVTVDRPFVTKAGKTSWTFAGKETAAFIPIDDRPAKATTKATKATTKATTKAPAAPAAPAVDMDAIVAAAVAQAVAAAMAAIGQPAPADPAPSIVSMPVIDVDHGTCESCGDSDGPFKTHRGAIKVPHLEDVKVCTACQRVDPVTVIARRDKREALANA